MVKKRESKKNKVKRTNKKIIVKRRGRKMVTNPYEKVPNEHVFHFADGKTAHNLKDLFNQINTMSEDNFAHHVNDDVNDFANWTEFVYKNNSLADDLRKIKDKKRTLEIIGNEIGEYDKKEKEFKENGEKKKRFQIHEKPITLSGPSQIIKSHTGENISTISTEEPHKFVLREFLYGSAFGAAVVFILILVLRAIGLW